MALSPRQKEAPRYFVQVVFYEIGPDSHFIGGEPAPAGQIWIRADIRFGRTQQQKTRILNRILEEVSEIMQISKEEVWVYISDIPAESVAEHGRSLPAPGQENNWLASGPAAARHHPQGAQFRPAGRRSIRDLAWQDRKR
jgi:phenylpyruvate tautomerase PptA (4-oxalocrotonate tautomerase family)